MEDPSPPILVVKWFSVALLGLAIYHSHLDDRYQNYFLVAGLASATIIANNSSQGLLCGIQTYLPFCVVLALCWSAVVHKLGRAVNRSRRQQKESFSTAWALVNNEDLERGFWSHKKEEEEKTGRGEISVLLMS